MKETFVCEVTGYGYDGEGVSRLNGKVVFLPYALRGEEVEFKMIEEKSSFARGRVEKVCRECAQRVKPPCPYFGTCGGCTLQHASYTHELEIKQELLIGQLQKIGYNGEVKVVASPKEYGYRNKIRLFIGNKGLSLKERASSVLVSIDKCLLVRDRINDCIEKINNFIKVQSLQSQYKEVVIREENEKVLVNFVLSKPSNINYQGLYLVLGGDCGIFETYKGQCNHKIGLSFLETSELGFNAKFSINSFHQVNAYLMEILYRGVIDNITGNRVINCYSGAGVLSGVLAKHSQEVVGIELGKCEHEDAESLKKENNLSNLTNICGDCADILAKFEGNADTIIVDPPRAGVCESVCNAIDESDAKRLIYISCNSATLVRDLGRIKNFKVKKVALFDMFARTGEYEVLAILDRA